MEAHFGNVALQQVNPGADSCPRFFCLNLAFFYHRFLYVVISYNFLKFFDHRCINVQALHRMGGGRRMHLLDPPFKINSNYDHFLFEKPN